MASTYLTRTTWGTPTNKKKFTFSFWFKISKVDKPDEEVFLTSLTNPYSSTNRFHMSINGDEQLKFEQNDGGYNFHMITNRKFRDNSGWYHAVFKVDTTQATQADRFKLYINGVEETSFATSILPSQNLDVKVPETDRDVFVGSWSGSGQYWDGYMTYFYYTDGYAYDASTFGSFDSNGIWKINTSPSVSYGTNGFLILKDGNTITDESSNSNDFTLGGGTLTDLQDCPSNVFATLNSLNNYFPAQTLSNNNTKSVVPNKNGAWLTGTLGMNSGKYYWEIKTSGDNSGGTELQLGIADKSPTGNSNGSTAGTSFGYNSNGEYGIYVWNGAFIGNAVANPYTAYGSGAGNAIVMIAVDIDNNKFWAGKDGTWFDSGNPATGANGKTIQAVADTVDGCYYPAISTFQGYTGTAEFNFGNGYFGTTAISSEGTNASGIGKFEYDVPTGFTALCTKGLNE